MTLVTPFPTFRDRITVYSIKETADTHGGYTEAEVSVGSMWAAVDKLTGREMGSAGGVATDADWRITVWYNALITSKCIAKVGSHVFDILDVNDIEHKHQHMVLACKERKGGA